MARKKTKRAVRKRKARTSISEFVTETLNTRASHLAKNITINNAYLKRLLARAPKPKRLTKAQIAKQKRDRKLGKKYLAKAHALGVYEDRDDY